MNGIWLAAAIASEVGATLSMRASDGFRRRLWLIPVAAGYLLAFAFLSAALSSGMGIGVAYGIWTALGIALVALLARVLWKDRLTPRMIVGIGLVMAGVVLVEAG